ncbi:phosphoribosyltransferase [Lewinellaceae bacterium SD302]|nr:phosphoribosyltransferase [Lewinellaceae bacterium SD302]
MELLNQEQIRQKIDRLAMEIMERNTEENELFIVGINNRGLELGRRLQERISQMAEAPIHLWNVRLNPADPMEKAAEINHDVQQLAGKAVLLVDDVANTGRTLFYALRPILEILPSKLEVAVLVDRQHKAFPVQVTYVGMELSTTIGSDVLVNLEGEESALLT